MNFPGEFLPFVPCSPKWGLLWAVFFGTRSTFFMGLGLHRYSLKLNLKRKEKHELQEIHDN